MKYHSKYNPISEEDIQKIWDIFAVSINDWPVPVNTPSEYIVEVEKFIEAESTLKNIQKSPKLKQFSLYSWEAESLYQIQEVFAFFEEGITLRDILIEINQFNL